MFNSSRYNVSNGANSIEPYRTCCTSMWTLPACVTRITPIANKKGKIIPIELSCFNLPERYNNSTKDIVRIPESTPPTITATGSLPPTANTAITIPSKTE